MGQGLSNLLKKQKPDAAAAYYMRTRLSMLFSDGGSVESLIRMCGVLEHLSIPIEYEEWIAFLSLFHALFCGNIPFDASPSLYKVVRTGGFFRLFGEVNHIVLQRILELTESGNPVLISLGANLMVFGTIEDKFRIFFEFCDTNHDGRVTLGEFASAIGLLTGDDSELLLKIAKDLTDMWKNIDDHGHEKGVGGGGGEKKTKRKGTGEMQSYLLLERDEGKEGSDFESPSSISSGGGEREEEGEEHEVKRCRSKSHPEKFGKRRSGRSSIDVTMGGWLKKEMWGKGKEEFVRKRAHSWGEEDSETDMELFKGLEKKEGERKGGLGAKFDLSFEGMVVGNGGNGSERLKMRESGNGRENDKEEKAKGGEKEKGKAKGEEKDKGKEIEDEDQKEKEKEKENGKGKGKEKETDPEIDTDEELNAERIRSHSVSKHLSNFRSTNLVLPLSPSSSSSSPTSPSSTSPVKRKKTVDRVSLRKVVNAAQSFPPVFGEESEFATATALRFENGENFLTIPSKKPKIFNLPTNLGINLGEKKTPASRNPPSPSHDLNLSQNDSSPRKSFLSPFGFLSPRSSSRGSPRSSSPLDPDSPPSVKFTFSNSYPAPTCSASAGSPCTASPFHQPTSPIGPPRASPEFSPPPVPLPNSLSSSPSIRRSSMPVSSLASLEFPSSLPPPSKKGKESAKSPLLIHSRSPSRAVNPAALGSSSSITSVETIPLFSSTPLPSIHYTTPLSTPSPSSPASPSSPSSPVSPPFHIHEKKEKKSKKARDIKIEKKEGSLLKKEKKEREKKEGREKKEKEKERAEDGTEEIQEEERAKTEEMEGLTYEELVQMVINWRREKEQEQEQEQEQEEENEREEQDEHHYLTGICQEWGLFKKFTSLAKKFREFFSSKLVDPGSLYCEGYLEEQIKGGKWRKRYFFSTPTLLLKFLHCPPPNLLNHPRSARPLSQCRFCDLDGASLQFCLIVKQKQQGWKRYWYRAPDIKAYQSWIQALHPHLRNPIPINPSSSFAPVRERCSAEWFVTAREYYKSLYLTLLTAKRDIFIAGWFVSPDIYLIRHSDRLTHGRCIAGENCLLSFQGGQEGLEKGDGFCDGCIGGSQLAVVLGRCCEKGVRVYVLVWKETRIAMDLASEYAANVLRGVSKNMMVITHPPEFPVIYSHHQKFVTIDQKICYIGGLDLCFGRYDDISYRLADQFHQSLTWPGKDYYNPSIHGLSQCGTPFSDNLDRTVSPRMPWQDVQMRVDGASAADVARNFIQRWNHHRPNYGYPILHTRNEWEMKGSCTVQCLRSLSTWSGGVTTEKSIMDAYVREIRKAEYYIYIEQQFFISSTAGEESVKNPIAKEITKKILHAHRWKKVFRVIIVLPVFPEGELDSENVQTLLRWQCQTIYKGEKSIYGQLLTKMSENEIENYISFYCLRSFDFLRTRGGVYAPKVSQIYVHSKLMIIDDRIVIMGSANINDRSLLGTRDSEIAMVVRDTETEVSVMNKKPFQASKFALSLRLHLWRVHLGYLSRPKPVFLVQERDENLLTNDPVSGEGYKKMWLTRAQQNREMFELAFPHLVEGRAHPKSDSATFHLTDLQSDGSHLEGASSSVFQALKSIQGTVCSHPMKTLIRTANDPANFLVKFSGQMVDRSLGLAT